MSINLRPAVFASLFLFLFTQVNAQKWPAGWQPVGVNDYGMLNTLTGSTHNVIAFNQANELYAACSDNDYADKIVVKKFDGTEWHAVGKPGFSEGIATYISLAFNNAGVPHVIYTDAGLSGSATVKKLAGNAWVAVGNVYLSNPGAKYNGIAFASDDTPYIVISQAGATLVKKLNPITNTWVNLAGQAAHRKAAYQTLVLDGNDIPYVTYVDTQVASSAAYVRKYDKVSGSWLPIGPSDANTEPGQVSGWNATFSTICFDRNNNLYAGFNTGKAVVRKYDPINNVWQTIGAHGFSDGVANYLTMDISADNTLYVAYSDYPNWEKTTVKKFDITTSAWVNVGPKAFSESGQYNYLRIDSSGVLHITHAGTGAVRAKVVKFNTTSSTWESIGPATRPGVSQTGGSYPKLAFGGPTNIPYVVYRDKSVIGSLTVKKFNGTLWQPVGVQGITGTIVDKFSIATHSDGTPYVGFKDTGSSKRLSVKKFDGSTWVNVGPVGFSTNSVEDLDIAFDSNNVLYTAYIDASKVSAKKFNSVNNTWVNVGAPQFSIYANRSTFAISPKDNSLYVCFRSITTGSSGKLGVYKFDGTAWVSVGPLVFSASSADSPDIVIDMDGVPYVSYIDNSTGTNNVTVKKYNSVINDWESVGAERFTTNNSSNPTLSLNSIGELHLVHTDPEVAYTFQGKATVKKFDKTTGTWVVVAEQRFSQNVIGAANIAFNKSDVLYAAYDSNVDTGPVFVKRLESSFNSLPVSLVSFNAKRQNSAANLQWETTNEVNNKRFLIYRSGSDKQFLKLGEVKAKTQSGAINHYSFIDIAPLKGNNYYKLVQEDYDGVKSELGIKTLNFKLDNALVTAFPNPTHDKVTVEFESNTYQTLTLSSAIGKILQRVVINVNDDQVSFNLSQYPKGVYLATLQGRNGITVKKVLKN